MMIVKNRVLVCSLIGLVSFGFTTSSGRAGEAKKSKDLSGKTIFITPNQEIRNFKFNIPILVPNIDNIKFSEFNNGNVLSEKYYIGKSQVADVQFVKASWFSSRTQRITENKEEFLEYLEKKRFYKRNLVGATITPMKGPKYRAFVARKGNCFWLTITVRLKGNTGGFSDFGQADAISNVVSCKHANLDVHDVARRLGFSTELDIVDYRARRSGSKPTVGVAANPPIQSSAIRRSIAMQWEGVDGVLSGNISIGQGNIQRIELTLPQGRGNCVGKAEFREKPRGIWFVKCDNGLTASGSFLAHGAGRGSSGEGFDNDGKRVQFTVSGS